MDDILNNGIPLILWFQSLGDWLTIPMKFFSFLGTENFYLLVMPVIYWGFDAALGLRLGMMLMLSSGVNTIFKFAFHSPRPYWVNTEVQALSSEASFGVPSGHAQNALTLWGVWASYLRKAWVWVIAIFVILGISLSRLYLAVHFPFDTLVGWVIGILLLVSFNRAWEPVSVWAQKQSLGKQIGAAFFASILLLLVGLFVASTLKDWILPVVWEQNAARAGGEMPDPVSLRGLITSSATLFGILAGVAWIAPKGGYHVASQIQQRILQYVVGILGLGILYLGLKFVFPAGDDLIAYIFRYIRYALVGFWISGFAPYIFLKLNLTN